MPPAAPNRTEFDEHHPPHNSIWHVELGREDADGVLVLTARGRLGHRAAPPFGVALGAAAVEAEHGFVLDLAGVDYVSSPALLAIRLAAEHLRTTRGRLVLCRVDEAVRVSLDLAEILPHVEIVETRADALLRVGDGPR